MYSNPLDPHLPVSNDRSGQNRETSQPSSSRPRIIWLPGLVRNQRRIQEWTDLWGQEKATDILKTSALPGMKIHVSPDGEHIEKLVLAWPEAPGVDVRLDISELLSPGRPSPLAVRLAHAAQAEERVLTRPSIVVAPSLRNQESCIAERVGLEETLRCCEEVLAPLASPTRIDSHPEGDTAEKEGDEEDNGTDDDIDSETDGKTKDMADDETGDATVDDMDEADEEDEADKADDKKGKQGGGNNKRKRNKKKRKRRRR
ncbi:hypothetical protein CHU98_g5308 [Xylaria longipes]|nr:hypothetical protein CHU98_g5308 [Xylaria longipes]